MNTAGKIKSWGSVPHQIKNLDPILSSLLEQSSDFDRIGTLFKQILQHPKIKIAFLFIAEKPSLREIRRFRQCHPKPSCPLVCCLSLSAPEILTFKFL